MRTIEILVEALKKCAAAHNVKFIDWREEGTDGNSVGLESNSVPVVADVWTIVHACGVSRYAISLDWGFTEVDLDYVVDGPVDLAFLKTALPEGSFELKFN